MSSTFHAGTDANYLRQGGSDTTRAFEAALGALEGGTALGFASGMAAIAAVIEGVPVGSVVVAPEMCYAGTSMLLDEQERLGRITVRRREISDSASVLDALSEDPAPALLWIESPTNPMMGIADLPVLIEAAHAVGALAAVDSTWNSPMVVRPIDYGADLVVHSATKYLAGHSDVLMGALICRTAEVWTAMKARRDLAGGVPGTLETFMTLRGMRTLAIRMDRAQANADELAKRLDAHPAVTKVLYAGLPDDPGHERVTRLHDGYGAMISFLVRDQEAADALCGRVKLITHATSLGGVESLIERRARYAVDAANGTPDCLLRFSVGIEDVEDLWEDLRQALTD
ncbi:cystathionine gamma-synthase [Nakamurella antarctica]|uniref:Cystathionine gamma-synthase n=1 Tax=Nakamurella antarctica TaxID=1902245 RepID=A0A3G8ZSH0_9ACTN|nr:PLP-dependent transferase [Nakamurella antarctica]AZI57016.1 cystathionine gamma-synthase [Nakamurella antarctica]